MYTLSHELNNINIFTIIIVTIVMILCLFGVIFAIKFQKKQKNKYKDVSNLINQMEDTAIGVKTDLTKDEINKIDSEVNVDLLMMELYNKYLEFINKQNNLDNNFDGILIGRLKDMYTQKQEICKLKNYSEIIDNIDLINYSITNFSKTKLEFRVVMHAVSYKMQNGVIVSGSNLEKSEIVTIIGYEKVDNNWLISSYEKAYENKIQDKFNNF